MTADTGINDPLKPARINWDDRGTPHSEQYGDRYYSSESGIEESRHVFLAGNRLADRWGELGPGQSFTICETGFGTGLNLLATAHLWSEIAPASAQLHFISTELHPLKRDDLHAALAAWPTLEGFSTQLLDRYPSLTPGFHRFDLVDTIRVTLIFDDVGRALEQLCPTLVPEFWNYRNWSVDAWFLDGFAPARNSAMWRPEVFRLMNRLSADNATVATFTCAGAVQRGLRSVGFSIDTPPGFGTKRQMLVARRTTADRAGHTGMKSQYRSQSRPGHRLADPASRACWHLDAALPAKPAHVVIVGAGIAGCTTAEALRRRGIRTTLVDRGLDVAPEASGNPQAALYARLSPDQNDLGDFCLHALNYARGFYLRRLETPDLGTMTGLAQLPRSTAEDERMQRIAQRFADAPELVQYLDKLQLEERAGIGLPSGGLWFPHGGWINGPAFNRHLVSGPDTECIPNVEVHSISGQSGRIRLGTQDGEMGPYDAVVLCNAMGAQRLSATEWLPIRPVRGQVSILGDQPETRNLLSVVCKETYLTPAYNGSQSLGATYQPDSDSSEVRAADHLKNLDALASLFDMEGRLTCDPCTVAGRAAVRATTPDYLPLVGALPSKESFLHDYRAWGRDRTLSIPRAHAGEPGMYLNLGFGSRGYVYAPLCAEVLACTIAREPAPMSTRMQRSIHPARFLVRSLVRNQPL